MEPHAHPCSRPAYTPTSILSQWYSTRNSFCSVSHKVELKAVFFHRIVDISVVQLRFFLQSTDRAPHGALQLAMLAQLPEKYHGQCLLRLD